MVHCQVSYSFVLGLFSVLLVKSDQSNNNCLWGGIYLRRNKFLKATLFLYQGGTDITCQMIPHKSTSDERGTDITKYHI